MRPWVARGPCTWDARDQRDLSVNAVERAELMSPRVLSRQFLHGPVRKTWMRLPPGLRESMEGRGLKRKALRAMGTPV